MIEVISGNIQIGTRYTVSNTVDGVGYITYQGDDYYQGSSFVGQVANDTYTTSDVNMKVYADDTLTDVITISTQEQGEEIGRFPEETGIVLISTVENFNENEEVVFPESTVIKLISTEYSDINIPSIINET